MITFSDAERIATDWLRQNVISNEPKFVPEHTISLQFGWVFFYQSEAYISSGDFRHAIAGNAPLLVEKAGGRIIILGTAEPVESYLQQYEDGTLPESHFLRPRG